MKEAFALLWPTWRYVLAFGFFTNLLVLVPSWYMLEVYDLVINSRNLTTLAMLTILVIFIYVVMEALEWVRKHTLYSAGS